MHTCPAHFSRKRFIISNKGRLVGVLYFRILALLFLAARIMVYPLDKTRFLCYNTLTVKTMEVFFYEKMDFSPLFGDVLAWHSLRRSKR